MKSSDRKKNHSLQDVSPPVMAERRVCTDSDEHIDTLLKAYFGDLQFSFSTPEFSTTWQCLEVGIMAGCANSPLAFIIRAS